MALPKLRDLLDVLTMPAANYATRYDLRVWAICARVAVKALFLGDDGAKTIATMAETKRTVERRNKMTPEDARKMAQVIAKRIEEERELAMAQAHAAQATKRGEGGN